MLPSGKLLKKKMWIEIVKFIFRIELPRANNMILKALWRSLNYMVITCTPRGITPVQWNSI